MCPQCDGCRVLVHQLCYGVATPPNGRLWLCDVCTLGAPSMPLSALPYLQLRFQEASANGCASHPLAMPLGFLEALCPCWSLSSKSAELYRRLACVSDPECMSKIFCSMDESGLQPLPPCCLALRQAVSRRRCAQLWRPHPSTLMSSSLDERAGLRVPPPCCLCPVAGGALKGTTCGRWAHMACALWSPDAVGLAADARLIDGIEQVRVSGFLSFPCSHFPFRFYSSSWVRSMCVQHCAKRQSPGALAY